MMGSELRSIWEEHGRNRDDTGKTHSLRSTTLQGNSTNWYSTPLRTRKNCDDSMTLIEPYDEMKI